MSLEYLSDCFGHDNFDQTRVCVYVCMCSGGGGLVGGSQARDRVSWSWQCSEARGIIKWVCQQMAEPQPLGRSSKIEFLSLEGNKRELGSPGPPDTEGWEVSKAASQAQETMQCGDLGLRTGAPGWGLSGSQHEQMLKPRVLGAHFLSPSCLSLEPGSGLASKMRATKEAKLEMCVTWRTLGQHQLLDLRATGHCLPLKCLSLPNWGPYIAPPQNLLPGLVKLICSQWNKCWRFLEKLFFLDTAATISFFLFPCSSRLQHVPWKWAGHLVILQQQAFWGWQAER